MDRRLEGGKDFGAHLVAGTVRRTARPYTPSVHGLLHHLERVGFTGAPRALGYDDAGREVLSYLHGETVGTRLPWPEWTHSDETLLQVARWLRRYHDAVADYCPPSGAIWREGGTWHPGLVIGHGDPAPYNAVWNRDLVGLIDWDNAGPVSREDDVAWTAFSWTPLHGRALAEEEGFVDFARRRERLRAFLEVYGDPADPSDVLVRLDRLIARHLTTMRLLAERGDKAYARMLLQRHDRHLEDARRGLQEL